MHFLVTGHTGFKGTWLVNLLKSKGHIVSGFSLAPESESLFNLSNTNSILENQCTGDIRSFDQLEKFSKLFTPDVVVHMAAQSLVPHSYKFPFETFETNLIGTLNVLRIFRTNSNVKCVLIVTSDKVNLNKNSKAPFTESDALGGSDPYSASKSIADIATQSWVASFKGQPTVIARAGNVIGGGDFNKERLIPELVTSFLENKSPVVRYPNMVRPWQHILDCLDGYYKLINQTVEDVNLDGTIWNFGPEPKNHIKVSEVAEIVSKKLSSNISWVNDVNYNPPESEKLFLDSSKAVNQLRWKNRLDVEAALEMTVNWYRDLKNGKSAKFLMDRDIENYNNI